MFKTVAFAHVLREGNVYDDWDLSTLKNEPVDFETIEQMLCFGLQRNGLPEDRLRGFRPSRLNITDGSRSWRRQKMLLMIGMARRWGLMTTK